MTHMHFNQEALPRKDVTVTVRAIVGEAFGTRWLGLRFAVDFEQSICISLATISTARRFSPSLLTYSRIASRPLTRTGVLH